MNITLTLMVITLQSHCTHMKCHIKLTFQTPAPSVALRLKYIRRFNNVMANFFFFSPFSIFNVVLLISWQGFLGLGLHTHNKLLISRCVGVASPISTGCKRLSTNKKRALNLQKASSVHHYHLQKMDVWLHWPLCVRPHLSSLKQTLTPDWK